MEKSLFSLVSVEVANLAKASFGSLVYFTKESKLTKGDKATIGCSIVEKLTTLKNVQLCYSYGSAVNRHIDTLVGKDAPDYQVQAPSGMHWVKYPLVLESNKEQGKYYLRAYLAKNTESDKVWFVDGKQATAEQAKAIDQILANKPTYGCAKQAASGLDEQDQVKPIAIAFENIVELHAFGDMFKGNKVAPQVEKAA